MVGKPRRQEAAAAGHVVHLGGGHKSLVAVARGERKLTRDAALRELPVQAAPARLEMDKLHAQTPPTAYAETSGGQRLLLWGVLLLGAACMAFMAVQLLRKPKE